MSSSLLALNHGSSLILPTLEEFASPRLMLLIGGGRGCTLKVNSLVAGIWIPLRGRLQLSGSDTETSLYPGDLRVTETESRMQAVGRSHALWVALLGSPSAWRTALGGMQNSFVAEPLLLPALCSAPRELRRRVIELTRSASHGDLDATTEAILDGVRTMQSQFEDAIARCPGRSYMQRRQVFLRLQRVRLYVASNCQLEFDNEALARMASYSPWHFIRAFRAAYRETPHAYLVRQRLLRARRLLRSSPLAIGEVASASGFENRCAFSRLFRQRFGTTAGALRRQQFSAGIPETVSAPNGG